MNRRGQKKISMPSSYGGIVRYFEEYKSKIVIKPGHVIFLAIVTIITIILLHIFGSGLLAS